MAAVVTTTTVQNKFVFGTKRMVLATLALDTGDYAAGGFAVTAGQFGLNRINEIIFPGAALEVSATPTGQLPYFNAATSKVQIFQSAAADAPFAEKGAEAFGTGASVRVVVIGH
jgi:hypothetical protein